jgi:hypothetical protein
MYIGVDTVTLRLMSLLGDRLACAREMASVVTAWVCGCHYTYVAFHTTSPVQT